MYFLLEFLIKYCQSSFLRTISLSIGVVSLLENGDRFYGEANLINGHSPYLFSQNIPVGSKRLWLVISPAPTRYFKHQWDNNENNDIQWPYSLSFNQNIQILNLMD